MFVGCGRTVYRQDRAFGSALPIGEGLFAFSTMEEILAAAEAINGDYEKHRRAAHAIARDLLSCDVVLTTMIDQIGLSPPRSRSHGTAVTHLDPA
jgi:hypothetical protein